ncbi:malto-oligosyltrehalose synthase [Komagataeibacter sp. FNDCR2]|uniref:malto-oligosyltrehalose synthase n=1 Tax=Komagataeibacter sp. FNDCR2 TaxID=2878682 RepID=UPI001E34E3FD|nr:malto-oligosyltrehalose synthase [Komagataeibacter sp. FNDCR2]MCE2574436.1 malto-oligosyltrehalose synthase [Komagataeibacter sp. FNDCR2]
MHDMPTPPMLRALARVQFRNGMTLDDARDLVPQFARLGISHLYASPLLAARPGSTHGYDTVGYDRIDPALGGEAALARLSARLHAHGMGLVLDIVPNHMAADFHNPWWMEVLAWGQASPYATWFDIDWTTPEPELHGRVVLPFLDRPLAGALAAGLLRLHHDGSSGLFYIHHHDHRFPLCPAGYAGMLAAVGAPGPLLASLTTIAMRARPGAEVNRALAALRQWGATDEGHAAMARIATLHDGTSLAGRTRLGALLEHQPWRLAWWRDAATRINWRRFFDITGLVSLCVERENVFDAVHGYVLSLYQRGLVDGLRVDHIDGLSAPAAYCQRLRDRLARLAPRRPANALPGASIHVEKILLTTESLPAAWPVDGTTGYEFMDQVSAVLHDPDGGAALDRLWATCGRDARTLDVIVLNARAQLLEQTFPAEYRRLITLLDTALHRRGVNCAAADMAAAVGGLLTHFRPYRTYFGDEVVQDHTADQTALDTAKTAASRPLTPQQGRALEQVARVLVARPEHAPRVIARRAQQAFEHLTAPLAAKSLEDTGFYRYARLLSRNEVGSDPAVLSLSVPAFHIRCADRLSHHPDTLLATATHDHKRGEDSRARLAVLSEMAVQWETLVQGWFAHNNATDAAGPDRIDELMLYQTLLGAWPLEPFADRAARARFHRRIATWQTKALREAKRHTDWITPNAEYENACAAFTERLLDPDTPGGFLPQLEDLVARIAPAGALNGLAQTLLRLTTPGVPDLYQGCDLWDFSLVDPDNRTPVDFARRAALLEQCSSFDTAAATWRTGRIKQDMIRRILSFRQQYPDLFARGTYEPVGITGPDQGHAIAFLRRYAGMSLLVAAPRLPLAMQPCARTLAAGRELDFALDLPQHTGQWHSLLGEIPRQATMPFEHGHIPIACLVRDADAGAGA